MNVSIIGAGVSGLVAGCYLQMSGYHTKIFERATSFGGLCTSWKRGEYTFESGFQWLLGSGPANPFYQLWSELLEMQSIHFITHESRMDIEVKESQGPTGDKIFHLYTNLDRLTSYLFEISPEDQSAIEKLIRSMRKMQSFEIPPMIKKIPRLLPLTQKIRYIRYLPLPFFLNKIRKETNYSFARRLKSPFLREAFELLFDGEDLPLMIIMIPLAYSDLHATGYPIGGASMFVRRLMEKYLTLGGQIQYKSTVRKILVQNHCASGIQLENGDEIPSDLVLSAADWHFTVFDALDGRYVNKEIRKLGNQKRLKVYYSLVIVSLGIRRGFEEESHFLRFPVDRDLISPDGTTYSRLEAHIYNYDPTLAPEGKTVVSISFYTRNADYWIDLRETNRSQYDHIKKEFAGEVIDLMEKRFGRIKEFVEEMDVATPATLFRHTNNWKGSAQGWLPGKNLISQSPVEPTLPGLKNFYYAGHWSIPGGGLPVALKSARDVVQIICWNQGQRFGIDK
ncbi:MAG: NAD(P)/FAD-dependent oxidoreductase [Bacteroidetes bacterium]|nr:MAG: NAD(P)/FAD-dependent oxidoreductase [Bacteroidota bacterium]